MNVKFHKITCTKKKISFTWDFQNFTSVSTILVKFDIHFLWLPWWLITSLGLEKWKKECNNYSLNNYSGTLYNYMYKKKISFTWDFQNFTSVSTILVKFDIHFLWLPWWLITSLGLEKWKKECNNYSLNNYSGTLYKVFVRWELKLLNFLVDSVLKTPTVKID